MDAEPQDAPATDELKLVHELRTVQELRALSDPLRVVVMRLLKEQERSVKELCDILGERSTRLYYHVRELERAGLVRLVRTETKSGSVLKYYRAAARYVTIPFDLLQEQPNSPEAAAAVDWSVRVMEHAALDVRQALSSGIGEITDDDFFLARHFVRTTPERAREYVRKLNELHRAFLADDIDDGPIRYTLTSALVPTRLMQHEYRPGRRERRMTREPTGQHASGEASRDVQPVGGSVTNSPHQDTSGRARDD